MNSQKPSKRFTLGPIAAKGPIPALITVCLCVCCWTGCSSTGKRAAVGFASVEIQGNTPGQIHDAAVEVFQKSGFQVANQGFDTMVFEKQGTKWGNFAYGDWDSPVWVRVKASIIPVSDAVFRLQCDAFMIRDRGGATEEQVACFRSRPYQKLMDEVAERLRGPSTAKIP